MLSAAVAIHASGCLPRSRPPDNRGATVHSYEIDSEAVGRSLPINVVVPAGGTRGRPLLVFLHGRGGDENSGAFDGLFEALADDDEAPVVAFPYGGDSSYWHDRDSGSWGTYVNREVISSVVERYHVDPDRIAIGGISMGGFGALNLARLHPGRFCAAGGHSPALWRRATDTAGGAFDDATDFARNDLIAHAAKGAFKREHVWIDIGTDDPFLPGADAFVRAAKRAGTRDLTSKRLPGGHDATYWSAHFAEYIRFYADRLEACR